MLLPQAPTPQIPPDNLGDAPRGGAYALVGIRVEYEAEASSEKPP